MAERTPSVKAILGRGTPKTIATDLTGAMATQVYYHAAGDHSFTKGGLHMEMVLPGGDYIIIAQGEFWNSGESKGYYGATLAVPQFAPAQSVVFPLEPGDQGVPRLLNLAVTIDGTKPKNWRTVMFTVNSGDGVGGIGYPRLTAIRLASLTVSLSGPF